MTRGKILQLGRVPLQIRIMTSISGVSWGDAWKSREQGAYGGVPVFVSGLSTLLVNKAAAGRPKDVADVEALRHKKDLRAKFLDGVCDARMHGLNLWVL